MKRWQMFLLITAAGVLLTACNLTNPPPEPTVTGLPPAVESGTVIAVTSSIPTSSPQAAAASGNRLPSGTLILSQLGKSIAQLPGASRQTVSIPEEQFGAQASPDGRYGVRFVQQDKVYNLALVDFSGDPTQAKDIPQGKGLSGPGVTWKVNSSGFAFFDFPPPDNPKASSGAILYYEVGSGQTKQLVPPPTGSGLVATAIAFSPDSKYLLYAVGSASGEGIGGPGSQVFLFDATTNQSTTLPAESFGFNQWLKDSKGFIAIRSDPNGMSQVFAYYLNDLTHPRQLTPAKTSDFFVDLSPDGKYVVVSSTPATQTNQVGNIYMMNLDGSNRKQLTKLNAVDQTITGLVWGNDGIYYSLSATDNNPDTAWRMDLDGSNATQVAQGTLISILGAQ